MYVDKEVIHGLKLHDEKSFNIFYDNYKKLLFFIIVSIVKNEDIATDLLQDTFIKIFNNVENLKNDSGFHQYVCLIARNIALDYLRKKSNFVENLETILYKAIEQPTEYTTFSFNEYLSNIEQLVITYNVIYEFTFQEIASFLNMKLSKVYSIYKIAKQKMKKYYEKEGHL